MKQPHYTRRNYFINKEFQGRYIFNYFILVTIGSLLFIGVFSFFSSNTLSIVYDNYHLQLGVTPGILFKKILKFRDYSPIESFDPAMHSGIPEETANHAIYNKLVSYVPGDKWAWQKEAAESIERFLSGRDIAAGRDKPEAHTAPTPQGVRRVPHRGR